MFYKFFSVVVFLLSPWEPICNSIVEVKQQQYQKLSIKKNYEPQKLTSPLITYFCIPYRTKMISIYVKHYLHVMLAQDVIFVILTSKRYGRQNNVILGIEFKINSFIRYRFSRKWRAMCYTTFSNKRYFLVNKYFFFFRQKS